MTENAKFVEKTIEVPKFAYAGFWIRLVAYIVDMLTITSTAAIINGLIFSKFLIELPFGMSVYRLLFWICLLLYFPLMTYYNQGQTLGKMITGIRVISLISDRLSLSQVLTREVCGRYIAEKIKILYLIIGFTSNKQSMADMLADTVVIKDDIVDYLFDEN
ncbi:MAG: RDD family protein [Peptoniphilaceae bacterium]|nr:RDD family protein [Peptoniphilaceae bacterium]